MFEQQLVVLVPDRGWPDGRLSVSDLSKPPVASPNAGAVLSDLTSARIFASAEFLTPRSWHARYYGSRS